MKVIQEVDLPEIFKLSQRYTRNKETKYNVPQKKTLEKGKFIWYFLLYSLPQELMDYVIG